MDNNEILNTNENMHSVMSKAFAMAPESARAIATQYSNEILNQTNHTKEQLMKNILSLPKTDAVIEPLIYADEEKWYVLADAAFLVYAENVRRGRSKAFSWMISNAFLLGNIEQQLFAINTKGRDLQQIIDMSVRSPVYFMIRYFILGFIKFGLVSLGRYKAYTMSDGNPGIVDGLSRGVCIWIIWATIVAEIKLAWVIIKGDDINPVEDHSSDKKEV